MYLNDINPCKRSHFLTAPLLIAVLFIVSSLFILTSCEDPSFVGLEIQPEEDRFRVRTSEETAISSSLWTRDSLPATGFARSVLGVLNDPLFGQAKASFMTQVVHPGPVNFGNNPVADSLVLHLRYTGTYGDPQAPLNINVFELSEAIDFQRTYYSNHDPSGMIYSQDILASQTIMQATGDTIISVHITNEDFWEKLISPPDDSVYNSGAKFVEYMKGLYLEALPAGETGTMLMVNLNDVNTRLSLYYRNTDFPDSTMTFNYVVSEGANINLFEHDHSTAVFAGQLGQTGTADTVFYVQGIAGVMGRLDFEQLHAWRDSMPVSINSARLILPVEGADATAALFPRPPRLTLFERNQEGVLSGTSDILLGDAYFGGAWNAETGEYNIGITTWMQNFILNENISNSLYVSVRDAWAVPNRTVMRNGNHPLGGPRLEITYTRH